MLGLLADMPTSVRKNGTSTTTIVFQQRVLCASKILSSKSENVHCFAFLWLVMAIRMVPHGTPWRAMALPWHYHGLSWHHHDTPMGSHGKAMTVSLHIHGRAMKVMVFHGIHDQSWAFIGFVLGLHGNSIAETWAFMVLP